jgi:hypothetical protein
MLQALREQHGTAREWALRGGIPVASIDRLRRQLITP